MNFAAPRQIPFTAIDAYARRYNINGDEFEHFLILIQALDSEYLQIENEKLEKQAKKK